MEYYGDSKSGGVNGHYYHVFNTVRTLRHPPRLMSPFRNPDLF